ncbi:hypothetical protein Caci_6886 [Catenulispora acidiphila DSM 44928]|uniref:Uncharacterized protein n=1 Tax=Catenulispora acidiphila (strain DSM 44928 / JCM 14897 / NBRC 102108 / NRRL B-24433 / ID139908) TaxID=479433 RepID=C7Q3F9_CATAD|nr:hypothetical protein Caci_6886 [Catenulispora acidiphila DSM 44928]
MLALLRVFPALLARARAIARADLKKFSKARLSSISRVQT